MTSQSRTPALSPAALDEPASRGRLWWLLAALVVVSLNLRAPISAVSALLTPIASELGLSGLSRTGLTVLPTVCLALFAFAGPALVRRMGEERLVATGLVVLLVGNLVRTVRSEAGLFLGTLLAVAAIGAINGTIPGLIKRRFSSRLAPVMTLYTIVLTLGAAGASALAPRLSGGGGTHWLASLAWITVPVAVVACVAWLPVLRQRTVAAGRARIPAALWRDGLAWQVTAFFGFMGLSFYFVLGWLPTICHQRGMTLAEGGLVQAVTSLIQVAGSLAVPVLIRRLPDQRGIAVVVAVLNAGGLIALVLAPVSAGAWIAAVLLGLSQGAGFALGLTFIGLRAKDADTAVGLSGMAQGVGYLIAILGPLIGGMLITASAGLPAALVLLLVVTAGELIAGLGAGRNRHVLEPAEPRSGATR
ncbi:MFS transporter [Streptomyces sp. NPDC090052]|uniref:MFS transporter n=1 Tax=unclassified Streptomyces TaxID=2593676 RepID=UPI0037FEACA1|nr:MFS transporter [Streptomyces sp. NBC_01020]WSX44504.1 MFS transporter [Streptomyces sp. NBC_00963]